MSNLTKPADSKALSNIDKNTRELRYGTRLIKAVVGMNCVVGTAATNAARYAVLFSRNPITNESILIERGPEDLLRRRDRDELTPQHSAGRYHRMPRQYSDQHRGCRTFDNDGFLGETLAALAF